MRERETSDRNGKLDDEKDEKNDDVEKQTNLQIKKLTIFLDDLLEKVETYLMMFDCCKNAQKWNKK